ncbi:MAG: BrnT family toxin [Pseudomonadales bacterium]|jgi:hypothetical protein|nr:BrnT family toxin [Pseudomonadales bacterium]MCC6530412.1 BrnT family toxin [Pseudomonadales bacterium]MCP5331989.1 BrnT family toxin [Pseudomonadales bacterium]
MEIAFDPDKSARNLLERGLSFERVAEFDFESALFEEDRRRDYGELRIRSFGFLDGRLHALVFVTTQVGIRVISLRRANAREVRHYHEQTSEP